MTVNVLPPPPWVITVVLFNSFHLLLTRSTLPAKKSLRGERRQRNPSETEDDRGFSGDLSCHHFAHSFSLYFSSFFYSFSCLNLNLCFMAICIKSKICICICSVTCLCMCIFWLSVFKALLTRPPLCLLAGWGTYWQKGEMSETLTYDDSHFLFSTNNWMNSFCIERNDKFFVFQPNRASCAKLV